MFDAEGKGFITAENLAKIASDLGEQIGESEIKEMINRADTDGDGHVNQTEFVQMLSKKPSV